MQKKYMNMHIKVFLTTFIMSYFALSQDMITTNLNDQLNTEITYQSTTNIDIQALEQRSLEIDRQIKSRFELTWRSPRKLTTIKIRPVLLEGVKIRKLNTLSNDMWIASLQPIATAKDKEDLDEMVKNGTYPLKYFPFQIKPLHISPIQLFDATDIVDAYSAQQLSAQQLNVQLLAINTAAFDLNELTADTSMFNVYWSAETYAELDNMRKGYFYSQEYGGQSSPRMKDLNDLADKSDYRMYYQWVNLLLKYKKTSIKHIKSSVQPKIIGEAWICNGKYNAEVKQQLMRNLAWAKRKGYNAVLVRFDCTEKLDDVLDMIQTCKSNRMMVFVTYVGQDNFKPRWSPFIDIQKFEPFFSAVVKKAEGLLLNWRSTSTHVRLLPAEYFNYICAFARESNSTILLYGEIYFGISDAENSGRRALYYNIPDNVTGVIVQNMGFSNYNYEYIVKTAFKQIVPGYEDLDKIFQVIGATPYYRTKTHSGDTFKNLTLAQEYKYKQAVEKQFKTYGAKTLTLLHDGVDDNYTSIVADPNDEKHWNDTTDNLLYDTTLTK